MPHYIVVEVAGREQATDLITLRNSIQTAIDTACIRGGVIVFREDRNRDSLGLDMQRDFRSIQNIYQTRMAEYNARRQERLQTTERRRQEREARRNRSRAAEQPTSSPVNERSADFDFEPSIAPVDPAPRLRTYAEQVRAMQEELLAATAAVEETRRGRYIVSDGVERTPSGQVRSPARRRAAAARPRLNGRFVSREEYRRQTGVDWDPTATATPTTVAASDVQVTRISGTTSSRSTALPCPTDEHCQIDNCSCLEARLCRSTHARNDSRSYVAVTSSTFTFDF